MLQHQPYSVQHFHPDIAISYKLLRKVAASMNLESDTAFVLVAFLVVGVFHEFDPLDPGAQCGWVADDAGLQLVPLAVLPKVGPLFRRDGQREGAIDL